MIVVPYLSLSESLQPYLINLFYYGHPVTWGSWTTWPAETRVSSDYLKKPSIDRSSKSESLVGKPFLIGDSADNTNRSSLRGARPGSSFSLLYYEILVKYDLNSSPRLFFVINYPLARLDTWPCDYDPYWARQSQSTQRSIPIYYLS